jgi:inhibitor of KinA
MMAPRSWKAVGDSAILIVFGDRIDRAINADVLGLDAAIAAARIKGIVETVPSYAALMICFDPLQTDHKSVADAVMHLNSSTEDTEQGAKNHIVHVDYGGVSGPDLQSVADQLGLSSAEVIAHHMAGDYHVYMGGFAPGYAYLGGTPVPIHLPRKPKPETGHPPGSIIIAGGQCLITTLPMPTGWWVIGRTRQIMFDPDAGDPFLLKPGDVVRFVEAARS